MCLDTGQCWSQYVSSCGQGSCGQVRRSLHFTSHVNATHSSSVTASLPCAPNKSYTQQVLGGCRMMVRTMHMGLYQHDMQMSLTGVGAHLTISDLRSSYFLRSNADVEMKLGIFFRHLLDASHVFNVGFNSALHYTRLIALGAFQACLLKQGTTIQARSTHSRRKDLTATRTGCRYLVCEYADVSSTSLAFECFHLCLNVMIPCVRS